MMNEFYVRLVNKETAVTDATVETFEHRQYLELSGHGRPVSGQAS